MLVRLTCSYNKSPKLCHCTEVICRVAQRSEVSASCGEDPQQGPHCSCQGPSEDTAVPHNITSSIKLYSTTHLYFPRTLAVLPHCPNPVGSAESAVQTIVNYTGSNKEGLQKLEPSQSLNLKLQTARLGNNLCGDSRRLENENSRTRANDPTKYR